jgi:hypothetical protein
MFKAQCIEGVHHHSNINIKFEKSRIYNVYAVDPVDLTRTDVATKFLVWMADQWVWVNCEYFIPYLSGVVR